MSIRGSQAAAALGGRDRAPPRQAHRDHRPGPQTGRNPLRALARRYDLRTAPPLAAPRSTTTRPVRQLSRGGDRAQLRELSTSSSVRLRPTDGYSLCATERECSNAKADRERPLDPGLHSRPSGPLPLSSQPHHARSWDGSWPCSRHHGGSGCGCACLRKGPGPVPPPHGGRRFAPSARRPVNLGPPVAAGGLLRRAAWLRSCGVGAMAKAPFARGLGTGVAGLGRGGVGGWGAR